LCSLPFAVSVLLAALFLAIGSEQVRAQRARGPVGVTAHASSGIGGEQSGGVDVGVLVNPTGTDAATVGLAYNWRLPHRRVRDDVMLLTRAGWRIEGAVSVQDDSPSSDQTTYPKKTGALFKLTGAPLMVGGAPALGPFLQALSRWNRVEVMFNIPVDVPQSGHFESGALTVDRVPAGIYQYEAVIRDHKGVLPPVFFSAAPVVPVAPAPARGAPRPEGGAPLGSIALIVVGLVFAGIGAGLVIARRHAAGSTAPVLHQ
jgi:hypothetical protein